MKRRIKKITVLLLISVITITSLSSCALLAARLEEGKKQPAESSPDYTDGYTLCIKTAGGMAMSDITVHIYDKNDKNDLMFAGSTTEDGYFNFAADPSKEYVATLSGVPVGYNVLSEYELSENTEIKLETVLLDPNFKTDRLRLGSIVKDFTLTDVNGNTYRISDLLNEKKAVVLNFWFIGCGPCKMEFPFMQQAYDEYKDDIEILAINPYDGTNATVKKYANDMSLSIPMFSVGQEWSNVFGLSAFPTTVVIDRYGMIAFAHVGSITNKETFEMIFTNFVSDGYTQKTYRNLNDMH